MSLLRKVCTDLQINCIHIKYPQNLVGYKLWEKKLTVEVICVILYFLYISIEIKVVLQIFFYRLLILSNFVLGCPYFYVTAFFAFSKSV